MAKVIAKWEKSSYSNYGNKVDIWNLNHNIPVDKPGSMVKLNSRRIRKPDELENNKTQEFRAQSLTKMPNFNRDDMTKNESMNVHNKSMINTLNLRNKIQLQNEISKSNRPKLESCQDLNKFKVQPTNDNPCHADPRRVRHNMSASMGNLDFAKNYSQKMNNKSVFDFGLNRMATGLYKKTDSDRDLKVCSSMVLNESTDIVKNTTKKQPTLYRLDTVLTQQYDEDGGDSDKKSETDITPTKNIDASLLENNLSKNTCFQVSALRNTCFTENKQFDQFNTLDEELKDCTSKVYDNNNSSAFQRIRENSKNIIIKSSISIERKTSVEKSKKPLQQQHNSSKNLEKISANMSSLHIKKRVMQNPDNNFNSFGGLVSANYNNGQSDLSHSFRQDKNSPEKRSNIPLFQNVTKTKACNSQYYLNNLSASPIKKSQGSQKVSVQHGQKPYNQNNDNTNGNFPNLSNKFFTQSKNEIMSQNQHKKRQRIGMNTIPVNSLKTEEDVISGLNNIPINSIGKHFRSPISPLKPWKASSISSLNDIPDNENPTPVKKKRTVRLFIQMLVQNIN